MLKQDLTMTCDLQLDFSSHFGSKPILKIWIVKKKCLIRLYLKTYKQNARWCNILTLKLEKLIYVFY